MLMVISALNYTNSVYEFELLVQLVVDIFVSLIVVFRRLTLIGLDLLGLV